MKKALYFAFTAFILTIMLLHSMPAKAVEVSFDGEYRIRAYAYDMDARKTDEDDFNDSRTYYDQRFRLGITTKVNDSLSGYIRLVAPNNDQWGTTSMTDSGNPWAGNVDFDLAYLDFAIPNTNLSARVGKQWLSLGNYIVLGSYATFDAIMINTKINNVDLALFTAKLNEDDVSDYTPVRTSSEDDEDLYGITLGFKPAPNMNVGIFTVMLNDGDATDGYCVAPSMLYTDLGYEVAAYADADAFWIGVNADIDYAPLKMKFEVDYSNVEFSAMANNDDVKDVELTGYAAFADICAELEYAKVGIAALMTTGVKEDEYNDKDELSVFVPISSRFSYFYEWDLMVINKYLEAQMGDMCISNLTSLKLYAMKDLSPKTKGTLSVQTYSYTEDPTPNIEELKTNLGVEIDAIIKHQLYENLTLTAGGAYWLTDKDTVVTEDTNDNWLLKLGLLYKF